VQLVRALQRHVDQLHLVPACAKDGNLEGAMFKARACRAVDRCASASSAICAPAAAAAERRLQAILKAEQDCKTTGYPDEAICAAALPRACVVARSARQRR